MAQKRLSEATKKRLKAGRMLLAGKGCADVAKAVGVARQTVYTWKALLDEGGIDALRAVPERGRPAQLDQAQLASVRAGALARCDRTWIWHRAVDAQARGRGHRTHARRAFQPGA